MFTRHSTESGVGGYKDGQDKQTALKEQHCNPCLSWMEKQTSRITE